ncbi:sigma-70 family RNA polymerase sigma factor [Nonomuraea sp. NPDC050556]|uniref:sigma-70 family RNA polymerase sigma factor n=1 Tax=Nonomuraea sp. NPDC050556 TaxID=3364369 RepID=UPI0037ABA61A
MNDFLAGQFEEYRPHLQAVAYRMLGSAAEAEDAVQEAWLRLSRTDTSSVENLGGWLTTIVGRVSLNMLRSRATRREDSLETRTAEPPGGADPEQEAVIADSVGLAMLVVLETLAPAERLAFVLHDLFGVPFDEIAPIVDRTPTAARQLASRARRRVQGAPPAPETDLVRQREIVNAFLSASRGGDFNALLSLLDPDVILRADTAAVSVGASGLLRGASDVAGTFSGRAQAAQLALINGAAGAVWAPGGRPRMVFAFTIVDGRIAGIDMLADPDYLDTLDLELLTN